MSIRTGGFRFHVWVSLILVIPLGGCVESESVETREQAISWGTLPAPGPTTTATPIGLALEIVNGAPVPLRVRKNQRFFINQIDMRTQIETTVDEGVAGLAREGDFADLDWSGTEFVDESAQPTPNPDGTFTRRRMFRKASWMDRPSLFVIEQLDDRGRPQALPLIVDTGLEYRRTDFDSFFTRRVRAIQWTNNCASPTDCTTATSFSEEALVELRYANGPNPNLQLDSDTTRLRVRWSANWSRAYTFTVEQIANPTWDYGLGIDLAVTTPAAPDGTYAAGQVLDVQFTLRDGSGKRLHEPGTMPTLADYVTGNNPSGIDYWNFSERAMTYYRRKHKERQMLVAIVGPVQDSQPIRDTLDFFGAILSSEDGGVVVARPTEQGFFAEAAAVPSWATLIGVVPATAPVSDTVQLTLPPDARSGTYKIVMKARRTYLGEEIPRAEVIEIQVGSPVVTTKQLDTGRCASCHQGGGAATRVGHAIEDKDRSVCTTCHVPLNFEPEGNVFVRTHFVHSRSNRFDADLARCASCHLDRGGIQRTSKAACLSCHKAYPANHVASYGPVTDMYIGGTLADSFQQCSTTCHTNHPRSGL
jgi:hypothetical protein